MERPPDGPTTPSLPGRIAQTVLAPGRLFATFGAQPPWADVLGVAVLVGLAVVLVIPSALVVEQATELTMEAGGEGPAPQQMAAFLRISMVVGAVVGTPLMVVLLAGVMTLLFTVFRDDPTRFRQHLSVSAHAALVPALGALVTLPLQLVTGDLQLQLSLHLLAPFLDPEGFLHRFLAGLNIFTLWWMAVAGVGAGALARKPAGSSAASLLAVYLGIAALVAGVATLLG